MKKPALLFLFGLLLLLASCQAKSQECPEVTGTPQYLNISPEALPTPTPFSGSIKVDVGGKEIQVDKVVEGPLCNDIWRGIVYVSCNVLVYPWQDHPTFLKNCDLNIEPNTVVYVAGHNNAAYYNGCSCHTAETPEP